MLELSATATNILQHTNWESRKLALISPLIYAMFGVAVAIISASSMILKSAIAWFGNTDIRRCLWRFHCSSLFRFTLPHNKSVTYRMKWRHNLILSWGVTLNQYSNANVFINSFSLFHAASSDIVGQRIFENCSK